MAFFHIHHFPPLALSAMLLAGCAAQAPLPIDWRHGAKHGVITKFYGPDTPRADLPACLAGLAPEQLATGRFARISYHHVRSTMIEVASVPQGQVAGIGQEVELWPENCSLGKLSRITAWGPQP